MPAMSGGIPRSGPAREALRRSGQFWTPDWVADAMVAYAARGAGCIYDPGSGEGAFARALTRHNDAHGASVGYFGCEIDPDLLPRAVKAGTQPQLVDGVAVRDFLSVSKLPCAASIVCNPPYVRHHRLSPARKSQLRDLALATIGAPLDGRTGLHAYFLLHALRSLAPGQRLSFIIPADICEGVYSSRLWAWIGCQFRIDAVVSFAPDATPFPGVDTNPIVLMIREGSPAESYALARVERADCNAFTGWVASGMARQDCRWVQVQERKLCDGLRAGISRAPMHGSFRAGHTLGRIVRAMRGIATGANDFFFLTSSQMRRLNIEERFFVRAVGRTRDVLDERIGPEHLDELDSRGRPTFLLSIPGMAQLSDSAGLLDYLEYGASLGLPARPLIAQRTPWFKMESRAPPPFLFAYLGRRRTRFLRNDCGVVPLTSFLCIYSRVGDSPQQLTRLGALLNDTRMQESLRFVAKTYGSGAMKLEPRAIERAPLSAELIASHPWVAQHLESNVESQLSLAEL